MGTTRLTAAQALVRFLAAQHVERDGVRRRFFGGCFGIFGHGNVAGIGQALLAAPRAAPVPPGAQRAGDGARRRRRTRGCGTASGRSSARARSGRARRTWSPAPRSRPINRLPVLLLPGDVFAGHGPDPVLQQLEVPSAGDVSVNDCFRPVSRYFDRISRPEQVIPAALAAMRVLTSPAETGAVTLAFPQDVQAEAFDYPEELFAERVWHVPRQAPDADSLAAAADAIRAARRPLIVAGGGVIYSEATGALRAFCEATGIPVGETQAGKGSLPYDHPSVPRRDRGDRARSPRTGSPPRADLVIGIGTRYSDFTTASKTAFQDPGVRFVNVNVADFDAAKHGGMRAGRPTRASALEQLADALRGLDRRRRLPRRGRAAERGVGRRGRRASTRLGHEPLPAQSEVIGAVNDALGADERRRLRGGRDAGRPAQALAHARPEGLPRRVRLLVHGLRDRRRASA